VKFETPTEVTFLLLQVDHGAERLDVAIDARVRPVDEVQVDAVEAEALERRVRRVDRLFVAVLATGHLRRDDELVADAAAPHRLADLASLP
jgi:hypothetical protein